MGDKAAWVTYWMKSIVFFATRGPTHARCFPAAERNELIFGKVTEPLHLQTDTFNFLIVINRVTLCPGADLVFLKRKENMLANILILQATSSTVKRSPGNVLYIPVLKTQMQS